MGNFERLSVLVIVVIIVLIVVIALVQLTEGNEATSPTNDATQTSLVGPADGNGGTTGGQNGGAGMNGNGVSIPATPRPPVTPTPEKKCLARRPHEGPAFRPAGASRAAGGRLEVEPLAAKEEPKVRRAAGRDHREDREVYSKAVTKGTDAILKGQPRRRSVADEGRREAHDPGPRGHADGRHRRADDDVVVGFGRRAADVRHDLDLDRPGRLVHDEEG
jgi:hypothetical protein